MAGGESPGDGAVSAGWSEFFRLNTRRGDDMDSVYNVVKSFTGWRGFDPGLGFWQPPVVLNTVVAVLFLLCCSAIAYVALTAPQRPGWRS
ncbi:conserved membrane domain protein [Mycobacterium xenopi 3993]|nr:conserved membrane domain protein [Mycobacterium xenopi 3993]